MTVGWAVPVALLGCALDYALDCIDRIDPAALDQPTPCAGWDLGTVLGHLDGSIRVCGEMLTGDVGCWAAGADPVAAVRGSATQLLRRLAAGAEPATTRLAGGPALPARTVACAGALEVAVHGWDIAQGTRALVPMPDGLGAALLVLGPCLVPDADRPGLFAPARTAPAGAGPTGRLVAFTGRSADWRRVDLRRRRTA